ncbi:Zinc finger, RanBP2-type [Dillenia turbinata]|uniref:Zinc finger, RanBP2-type n=1 Tax=Dillenia turbinata TaxID=194707 RepID=A0AAN8ZK95_9MAGN
MGAASGMRMLLSAPFPLFHPPPHPSLFRLRLRLPLSLYSSLSLSSLHRHPPRPHHHRLHKFISTSSTTSRLGFSAKSSEQFHTQTCCIADEPSTANSHPWPEWYKLVDAVSSAGYFNRQTSLSEEDEFAQDLPEEFLRVAFACLAFARERPNLLGLVSRKDVEVVVENGLPFLFKNSVHTVTRMKRFLSGDDITQCRTHPKNLRSRIKPLDFYSVYLDGILRLKVDECVNLDPLKKRLRVPDVIMPDFESKKLWLQRVTMELINDNSEPSSFVYLGDGYRGVIDIDSFKNFVREKGLETEKAQTVDLMRYLLSYASNYVDSVERSNLHNSKQVESSVQNLLCGILEANQCALPVDLSMPTSMHREFTGSLGQTSRPVGQNIEMKRGDWICLRCNFMNFARNVKCLECEEPRPKRQLTGGEWECPQCDFFNYGRNVVCLRCDCKRPGEVSFNTSISTALGYGKETNVNRGEIDCRLAANDEKAERWFNKVSQLDSGADLSTAIADEDFPEIMPLRKGVNRFVVSTRKTPLERRLANAPYKRNLGNDGIPEANKLQSEGPNDDTKLNRSLDEILGRRSTISGSKSNSPEKKGQKEGSSSASHLASQLYGRTNGSSSNYDSFVPFPADMFAVKSESPREESRNLVEQKSQVLSSKADGPMVSASGSNDPSESGDSLRLSEKPVCQSESMGEEKEQTEKSERWFKRVAELHNVTDLATAVSDDDFPEIMPMRKGENRFVVSKKKDRSLTSPLYKRRMAMEQASKTNFVPFVPFPPDYFAKKDEQLNRTESKVEASGETLLTAKSQDLNEDKILVSDQGQVPPIDSQHSSLGSWTLGSPGESSNETGTAADAAPVTGNMNNSSTQTDNIDTSSIGHARKENVCGTSGTGNSTQSSTTRGFRETWMGKSLEGSAVKDPDPLDMSEEAKAERWFRRVAQIKDISELSQIPDEDFPSIMPMRKGVNRFVVSKRKTPLERRLTSAQYRRNLPIVRSDPVKKENDNS